MSKSRFPLGRCMATPGALAHLASQGVSPTWLLALHASGEWGDLGAEDKATNEWSVENGERILSRYNVGDEGLYVITERDRSATTILLCHEY